LIKRKNFKDLIWLLLTCESFTSLFASSCNKISLSMSFVLLKIVYKIYFDHQSWHPEPCYRTDQSMLVRWLSAHLAFVRSRKSGSRTRLRVFWQIDFLREQMVCSSCMDSIRWAAFRYPWFIRFLVGSTRSIH